MQKEVLFIHGGGDDGYGADEALASSLKDHLGSAYHVRYPKMPDDETLPDFGWGEKIGSEIAEIDGELVVVGHSLGASMFLKFLSEHPAPKRLRGIFLLATPFWSGEEDWVKGLMLREDFADALPHDVPIYFYQCADDEEIDVSHLEIYAKKVPHAVIRKVASGGHQFGNDLALIAEDVRSLE